MTFWEQLKDAFNRFFGATDEPVPLWEIVVIFLMMTYLMVMCVRYDRVKLELDDELKDELDDEGGVE